MPGPEVLPSSASVGELLLWKLSSSAFSCSDDFPFTLSSSGNWLGTAFFTGPSLGSGVTSALTSTGGGGTPSKTERFKKKGPKHERIFPKNTTDDAAQRLQTINNNSLTTEIHLQENTCHTGKCLVFHVFSLKH